MNRATPLFLALAAVGLVAASLNRVLQIFLISASVGLLAPKPLTAEAPQWVIVPDHGPDVVLPEGPGPVLPVRTPTGAAPSWCPKKRTRSPQSNPRAGPFFVEIAMPYRLMATGSNFDDAAMELVGRLPMLARFSGALGVFTDRGMVALSKLHKLESIEIGSDEIGDAGIDCLRGLRNLKKLTLNCPRLTDSGLKALSGMERLEELTLTSETRAGSRSETPGWIAGPEVVDVVLPHNPRRAWSGRSPAQPGKPLCLHENGRRGVEAPLVAEEAPRVLISRTLPMWAARIW